MIELSVLIVILLVISLFLIPPDSNYVWVVEHDGKQWVPKRIDKLYLRFDQEYSKDYSAAFKEAKRKNYWHCDSCKIFK